MRDQHQRCRAKPTQQRPRSQSIESRSRWLVGSSSSSTSGAATSACASATRFLRAARQRRRSRASPSRCRRCSVVVDALLPVPAVERLDARLQRVEVVARRVRLVALAQRARFGHALADRVEHACRRRRTAAPADVARCAAPCCTCSRPSSSFSSPARTFSSDDLPAPLRPIRPTRSPASSEKPAPSSSGDVAVGEVGVGQGEQGHGEVWVGRRMGGDS